MAANLRERLSQDKIMMVPGVYDALTALLAQQAGMEAVFLSGSSVSYSQPVSYTHLTLPTNREV